MDWGAIVGVVVGAVLTYAGGWLTRRSQRDREDAIWDRQRARDEELWRRERATEAFNDFMIAIATFRNTVRNYEIQELLRQREWDEDDPEDVEEAEYLRQAVMTGAETISTMMDRASQALNRLALFCSKESHESAQTYLYDVYQDPEDVDLDQEYADMVNAVRRDLGQPAAQIAPPPWEF